MKILFICDPIKNLNYSKDSTIFLIEEAWRKNYEVMVCAINDLSIVASSKGPVVFAKTNFISKPKKNDAELWFELNFTETVNLKEFNIIFIRKDPPFDDKYSTASLVLQIAENNGIKIFNSPSALLSHNEKLSTVFFHKYIPMTIVSEEKKELTEFTKSFKKVVFKPLNEMGGSGIFVVDTLDPNIPSIIETLTEKGSCKIMVQKFLPEIANGDKRVLVINGEIINCCLVRTPKRGSYIGNLAAGGQPSIEPLSSLDRQIAEEIALKLSPLGFFILGLDIIGKYLTEINVTSPTGFREISKLTEINVGELFYKQVGIILDKFK